MTPGMQLTFLVACVVAAGGIAGLVVLLRGGSLIPERLTRRSRGPSTTSGARLAAAVAAGIVAVAVSGWPIAAVGAALMVVMWPRIFGSSRAGKSEIDKLEAIATWTESLRDLTAGGAGLEQAIARSAATSTTMLRPDLEQLAAQLELRVPLERALEDLADAVDDAACDQIVATIRMNSRLRAAQLTGVLGKLSETLRDEVGMRLEAEAKRRNLRREARLTILAVLAFIGFQVVFVRDHLEPFRSPLGQIVLAVIAAIWIGSFMRMRALSEPERPPRFLATEGGRL